MIGLDVLVDTVPLPDIALDKRPVVLRAIRSTAQRRLRACDDLTQVPDAQAPLGPAPVNRDQVGSGNPMKRPPPFPAEKTAPLMGLLRLKTVGHASSSRAPAPVELSRVELYRCVLFLVSLPVSFLGVIPARFRCGNFLFFREVNHVSAMRFPVLFLVRFPVLFLFWTH